MTQVEALAKYGSRFAPRSPISSAQSRQQLSVHVLDARSVAVFAALGAGPVEACRAQVADFGGNGPCALIPAGATPTRSSQRSGTPRWCATWTLWTNFLAPTETCHTADNFGVALTIADYVGGSGRDLMLAVALAYTVQSRFVDHANFMTRGFDHTAQLAFSLNAAAGKLLGLSEPADCGCHRHGSGERCLIRRRAGQAAIAVERVGLSAVSAGCNEHLLFLARRGVEGPLQVIEGPNGIDNLLHMQIHIDWDKQGLRGRFGGAPSKKYNAP